MYVHDTTTEIENSITFHTSVVVEDEDVARAARLIAGVIGRELHDLELVRLKLALTEAANEEHAQSMRRQAMKVVEDLKGRAGQL